MDAGDLRVCEYQWTCGKGCAALRSIPALSYYLQMPAAFNPWPDLIPIDRTAGTGYAEDAGADACGCNVSSGGTVGEKYAVYLEAGEAALMRMEPTEKNRAGSWIIPSFC